MDNNKIYVESMVNHPISILMPGTFTWKRWQKKGAKVSFNKEELAEAYFDPGIEYMFTHGVLYTEDMDFKKEIGLEPEDAKEPVNVIKLEDSFIKRMISFMPLTDFESELEKLSFDQRKMLVEYVIKHPTELKLDRTDLIDKKCGVHILKAIELKKQAEE